MARFSGKSVIVTGGASGIGRATALAFAAEGAQVMVADQNGAGAEAVAEAIRAAGGTAASFRVDISLFADCQSLVDHTVARFGGLHVAFNNAGIPGSMTKAVHEYDLEEWNRMITVNLTGVFHSIKAEVPAMLASGGGAIINTASVASLVAAQNMASYVTAKHGVLGLTKAAALDLIRQGIRVNAVCPGAVRTAMLEPALQIPEIKAKMESDHPIGRTAEPEEIAKIVLFLASNEASFIVGHGLTADGGVVLK
jgi:NAD(P)-dependent dehydrogenase (short-subunit alcohol dehydrogenase family)